MPEVFPRGSSAISATAHEESVGSAPRHIARKQAQLQQDMERVVTRVLPLVPKDKALGKSEFEVVLKEILTCLHENTQTSLDALAQKTSKVLRDLPSEYGRLPHDGRSWEAFIGYLYAKYLKELGML
jgi:hypothetical protein